LTSTFSKSWAADLIASICSWKVVFTSGLLLGLICSFGKIFFRRLFVVALLSPYII
jgi:hypothetical protein